MNLLELPMAAISFPIRAASSLFGTDEHTLAPDELQTPEIPIYALDPDRPTRKAPATKELDSEFPEYYEQMKTKDFWELSVEELRWLAREWDIAGRSKMDTPTLIAALVKETRERLKTWQAA
jgi:hypothetical protein